MNDRGKTVVTGLVALVVGALGGVGYGMMQVDEVNQKLAATTQERDQAQQSADRLRKMSDGAAKKYGSELGKLVTAVPVGDDTAKLLDSARALLAVRDNLRSSLDGVRASMDSDLDVLAMELGNPTPDADRVKQLLEALKQSWPEKEKAIEDASRKLLVDLGVLQQAPPAPRPQAAPAPAAAPAAPPPPAPAK